MARAWQLPVRLATGAFILNSGLDKRGADQQTAESLHGMAAGAYPFLGSIEPKRFIDMLSATEIGLGGALLAPVSGGKVGAALSGFAGSLLGMYWRTPGMHEEGDPRPTPQGTPIAKDVWLLGIGIALLLDAAASDRRDKRRKDDDDRDE